MFSVLGLSHEQHLCSWLVVTGSVKDGQADTCTRGEREREVAR